jgi:hypothetical protein
VGNAVVWWWDMCEADMKLVDILPSFDAAIP